MSGVLIRAESSPKLSFPYLLGFAGISFALCYAAVLASLVTLWGTYPLYSHGYAVPLIAGWLCWTKNRAGVSLQKQPDYVLGVPLILAGLSLLIVGEVGALLTVKQTSLIVALAGFVLVFFGRETLSFYRFPFAYLLLMVPIWDVGLNRLQDPSRLVSAKIAAAFLHLANVPVLRQETALVLASHTLSVLRQCSGINQLVAMLAMVLPASYVFLDTNRRRLALVAFSVVVCYLSNGFRIALVGWLAVNGLGDGDLAGSYTHLLEGLVVSAAGYAVILIALSFLARFNTIRGDEVGARTPTLHGSPSRVVPRSRVLDFSVIAILLITASMPLVASSKDVGLARELETLPSSIGSWRMTTLDPASTSRLTGIRDDMVGAYPSSTGVRSFVGADAEVARSYENSPMRLRVYVGYYRRQAEGRELAGDAARVLAAASTPLILSSGSETWTVREIVRNATDSKRGIIYWYDINGRIASDVSRAKAYTIWDGLTRHRTNGAVVIVTWDAPPDASQDGRAKATEFALQLLPILRTYFQH